MNSNLLVIDIGNTNTKLGHFVGSELVESWRIDNNAAFTAVAEVISSVDAPVAIASVVPQKEAKVSQLCKELNRMLFSVTGSAQRLISGLNPEMGADRVADAYAAYKLYGMCKRPVLVFGFGTATTCLAISASGHAVGGWIYPGVRAALKALHDTCALLPSLEMEGQNMSFGFDTESHIRNGVWTGQIGVVEKWIELGTKLFAAGSTGRKSPLAIATGGWAQAIEDHARIFDQVDPQLTLKGVYLIAEANGIGVTTTRRRGIKPKAR